MKKSFSHLRLAILILLLASVLTAATVPNVDFKLTQGLPSTMKIGDTATVEVKLSSDQKFISAQAMPDFQYAGKGVVSLQGGSRTGQGTSTTLKVTFKAKSSTAKMPGGVAPVSVVVGVRYSNGYVVVQRYDFLVRVP